MKQPLFPRALPSFSLGCGGLWPALVLGVLLAGGRLDGVPAAAAAEGNGVARGDRGESEKPDVVVLKDGRRKTGKVIQQTDILLLLRVGGGEVLPLAMSRVARIERGGKSRGGEKNSAVQTTGGALPAALSADEMRAAATKAALAAAQDAGKKQAALWRKLRRLGSPLLEERKAALRAAVRADRRALPLLAAALNPRQKTDRWLRIGVLRALVLLAPLDLSTAHVLAYTAMHDSDLEVRREACRAIRLLKEDRAVDWLLKRALGRDGVRRYAAALALREIDDERAFARLAAAVPMPSATSNTTGPTSFNDIPRVDLPVGPGGTNVPIFLPESETTAKVSNISSPASESLKVIAGKNLGNLPPVWLNWLNEKIGTITAAERDEIYRKRSLLKQSGAP